MPGPKRKSPKTPDAILEAAGRVIRRAGSAGLTIDAVAAEAAFSKGGVLHHFGSKDMLIAAMVTHQLAKLQCSLADHEAKLDPGGLAPLLAVIGHARANYPDDAFPPALLAASVESPAALDGFRTALQQMVLRLEREPGRPGEAVVLFFAMLGLFLSKGLGFHVFAPEQALQFLDVAAGMAAKLEEG